MRTGLGTLLALLLLAPAASGAAGSEDSEAPPGAPPHWLPNEEWVYQHWLPYDEERLYRELGMSRGKIWRILRDDSRTLAEAAVDKGLDPAEVARALVSGSFRGVDLPPERRALLESRALRTLTQGHLAQHILFHSLHQNAIPDHAPEIFGVTSRTEFQRLRRAELSPLQICRLYGGSRASAHRRAEAVLRETARVAVAGLAMPPAQARLLLARQLRQLPRWLQQTRYNGPPPVKEPRVSLATASNYSNNAVISADGRRVAFESYEASLPALRTKGEINVLVGELGGPAPSLASAPNARAIPRRTPRSAYNPSMSADGRYVAFEAAEGNLNFAKRYGEMGVFVRDLARNETRQVSRSDLFEGRDVSRSAYNPSLSADGRTVAFELSAPVLGELDIVVRDLRTDAVRRIELPGRPEIDLHEPKLSGDGRLLAFTDEAQVYVQDLASGATEAVSSTFPGESYEPALSHDGRFVAFTNAGRIVVVDRRDGSTEVIAPPRGAAADASLSADGQRVVYSARNRGDRRTRVEVLDRATGAVRLVSRVTGPAGPPADGTSGAAAISADGGSVVFTSDAWNLSREKCNPARGVFVRDLDRGTTTLLSRGDGLNRHVGPTSWSSSKADTLVSLLCA